MGPNYLTIGASGGPGLLDHCQQSLRATAAEATGVEQPVLAMDGKTARRGHDRSKGLGALHSVSVWASEFGLSLGQVACAEKSNEIRDCSSVTGADLRIARQEQGESTRDPLNDSELAPNSANGSIPSLIA